jgi:hypothetical protein
LLLIWDYWVLNVIHHYYKEYNILKNEFVSETFCSLDKQSNPKLLTPSSEFSRISMRYQSFRTPKRNQHFFLYR